MREVPAIGHADRAFSGRTHPKTEDTSPDSQPSASRHRARQLLLISPMCMMMASFPDVDSSCGCGPRQLPHFEDWEPHTSAVTSGIWDIRQPKPPTGPIATEFGADIWNCANAEVAVRYRLREKKNGRPCVRIILRRNSALTRRPLAIVR